MTAEVKKKTQQEENSVFQRKEIDWKIWKTNSTEFDKEEREKTTADMYYDRSGWTGLRIKH